MTRNHLHKTVTFLCLRLVLASGCSSDPPASPAAAQQAITQELGPLWNDMSDAVTDPAPYGQVSGSWATVKNVAGGEMVTPLTLGTAGTGMSGDLGGWLADHIFTADNYQGDGRFAIRGAAICTVDAQTGAPDPNCVANVDALAAVVRVTLGAGVTFTLSIGDAQPAVLVVQSGQAALTVDFAQVRTALLGIAAREGKTVKLPDVMQGVVSLVLTRLGTKHTLLSLDIVSDIRVSGTAANGEPVSVSIGKSVPVLSIEGDGTLHQVTFKTQLGPVMVNVPYDLIQPTTTLGGNLSLVLAGLTGQVTFAANATEVTFSGLSLGAAPSTLDIAGHRIASLALTSAPFDLDIRAVLGDVPMLSFAPSFGATLTYDSSALRQAGENFAAGYDGTYTLDMSGAMQAVPAQPGFPGGLCATEGAIDLSITPGGSLTAGAGSCLVGNGQAAPNPPNVVFPRFAVVPRPQ
jgi:hypothetical protein